METFRQDVRYALRALRQHVGFTIVAVLALALGIGANTAIFSVVNGVLLRPLPYADAGRVVMVWNHWEGWPQTWLSEDEFWDFRRQTRTLAYIAAFTSGGANLTGGDAPERVRVAVMSAEMFPLLGVRAALGRAFTPDEDRPGADRVAGIRDRLLSRRFGGEYTVARPRAMCNQLSVH